MQFSKIINQQEVKQQLVELIQHNRLSHALLFLSKEGSGALSLALALAQYLTCEKANPKSQLMLVEKMNHIFRTVDGDKKANVATYSNPSLPLADGLVKGITSFILKD